MSPVLGSSYVRMQYTFDSIEGSSRNIAAFLSGCVSEVSGLSLMVTYLDAEKIEGQAISRPGRDGSNWSPHGG